MHKIDKWNLSFVVVFKKISKQSCMKVFYNNTIIDEVECTSLVCTIDVPLDYQDDIQFEFDSADGNSCYFFGIFLTHKKDNLGLCARHFFLLPKSADQPEANSLNLIHYNGDWFGGKILDVNSNKKKLWAKSTVTFKSKLRRVNDFDNDNSAHKKTNIWLDGCDNKKYVPIGMYWIDEFRPGIACFYRQKNFVYYPRLNIFQHISFDVKNGMFALTKFTGAVVHVPSDRFLGSKNISNQKEYLNFIRNALFIFPGIYKHSYNFCK